MNFVLTTSGIAALTASPSTPLPLSRFELGDAFNYTPSVGQTAIQGSQVWSGVPSDPVIHANNIIKYTVSLDANVGDFAFGEVGLFLPGGILLAIGSATALIPKVKHATGVEGNSVVVDCYISSVNGNYAIYAQLGNSSNELNLQSNSSVDSLEQAVRAYPNILQIPSPDGVNSCIAFSNNSLWSISGYEEQVYTGVVSSITGTSVTSASGVVPNYPGELLIQFTSGASTGIIRRISGFSSPGTYTWSTPVLPLPGINDEFQILKKNALRAQASEILANLAPGLTSGHINDLLNYPLSSFVNKFGTVAMQASFDAGGYTMQNLANPVNSTDAATKSYVDGLVSASSGTLSALSLAVSNLNNTYFRKDGLSPMTANLPFGGFRGVNLATPLVATDAATKGYVDSSVSALSGLIVTSHNALSGKQGGSGSDYYHLTAAQYSFVQSLVSSGYPIASYTTAGITAFASLAETSAGTLSTKAITPENLRLALESASPNNLQAAVLNIFQTQGQMVQSGLGAPTGFTSAYPPIYLDKTVSPYVIYVHDGTSWRSVTATLFQVGVGVPDPVNTPKSPTLYFDATSTPLVPYAYTSGAWELLSGPIVQFDPFGPPTVATPTHPPFYVDSSSTSTPILYAYDGTQWLKVGSSSDEPILYFYGQL